MTARQTMGVRISAAGREHIAKLAAERGEPPSAVMRAMLVYAVSHMPHDYLKPKDTA